MKSHSKGSNVDCWIVSYLQENGAILACLSYRQQTNQLHYSQMAAPIGLAAPERNTTIEDYSQLDLKPWEGH